LCLAHELQLIIDYVRLLQQQQMQGLDEYVYSILLKSLVAANVSLTCRAQLDPQPNTGKQKFHPRLSVSRLLLLMMAVFSEN